MAMNLITAPPVLTFEDWVVEIHYLDFAMRPKFRAIGVSRQVQTEDEAMKAATDSLRKSHRRDGFILPPEIKDVTAKRRREWGNKYALNRARQTSERAESQKYA